MKVLIWIGCIFCASLVQTIAMQSGIILGGLPTLLLYGAMFFAASALCKAYDERQRNRSAEKAPGDAQGGVSTEGDEARSVLYCRKCGAKLIVGRSVCHVCGTQVEQRDPHEMS